MKGRTIKERHGKEASRRCEREMKGRILREGTGKEEKSRDRFKGKGTRGGDEGKGKVGV